MKENGIVRHLTDLWQEQSNLQIHVHAAGAGYFIVLAVFPMLVLLLGLLRYTGLSVDALNDFLEGLLPQALMGSAKRLILNAYRNTSGTVISLSVLVALWSASRGIYGLMQGFNAVYHRTESRSWLHLRLLSVLYTVLFLAVVLATLVVSVFGKSLLQWLPMSPLLAVLSEKYHRYGLMMNHEYMSGLSARNLTQSTVSARAEIHAAVDALRSIGGMWEDVHITSTADMIGVREGRRLKGLYEVNKEDVSAGRCFEDAVCTIWFDTDVHNLKPGDHSSKYGTVHPPYQIPLRSLISAEIDNLLMGGRCISGDFVAHGSYRVAGPAFRTGEVAGKAAAHCALNGILPKDIRCVQDVLGSEE